MRTIYKYPFSIKDRFTLEMPAGASILKVECQGDQPCIWAMVDTEDRIEVWTFRIVGTGHPLDDRYERSDYVATFQQGPFVWHLFH